MYTVAILRNEREEDHKWWIKALDERSDVIQYD